MNGRILALWTTPRARSTAFTWMMKQRGDFEVLIEPFGPSAYYSKERLFERATDVPPNLDYNYKNILERLRKKSQRSQLFVKDFAFYFLPRVTENFLNCFHHTFLIRDPAQMLPSYYYKWPNLRFEECGYRELHELFELVMKYTGQVPVVINADDLVEHASAIVQAYCSQCAIPFIAQALTWDTPGNSVEIGWWQEDRTWTDNLRSSRGFYHTRQPGYLSVHGHSTLRSLYEQCLPYYEKLNQYRLHPQS